MLEREIPDAFEELSSGQVASLVKPCPGMTKGIVHEHVRLGLVSGVSGEDLFERILHEPIVAPASSSTSPSAGVDLWELGGGDWDFPASNAGRFLDFPSIRPKIPASENAQV